MRNGNIKIAYLNENQKIWFIRAESGVYANNFEYGQLIAIKHLEEAMKGDLGNELPSEEKITSALLKNDKYSEFIEDKKTQKNIKTLNRAGRILLGQIKRFVYEIEAGDIIVTKNIGDGYNIGVCVDSTAYIDQEPVRLPKRNDEEPEGPVLRYKLRKKVVWGPSIQGKDLPHSVRRATRGQQTISNLSDHRVKIFHLIYPFFTDGEHLYFSNKIRRRGDINARVIGKLFENVSFAEKLIEALVSDGEFTLEQLVNQLNKNLFAESFVACKAEFMSPGDMWCKIPLSQAKDLLPQIAAGVLVCLLLTGQTEAAQLDSVSDINPDAKILLKANEDSPSTNMFNEKFKAARPSSALKDLANKLQNKEDEIRKIESQRSTNEVQENLNLEITSTPTRKLENFKFGINVIELRGLSENN